MCENIRVTPPPPLGITPLHTCQNFQIQILYLHCEMTLKAIPPEVVKICRV